MKDRFEMSLERVPDAGLTSILDTQRVSDEFIDIGAIRPESILQSCRNQMSFEYPEEMFFMIHPGNKSAIRIIHGISFSSRLTCEP